MPSSDSYEPKNQNPQTSSPPKSDMTRKVTPYSVEMDDRRGSLSSISSKGSDVARIEEMPHAAEHRPSFEDFQGYAQELEKRSVATTRKSSKLDEELAHVVDSQRKKKSLLIRGCGMMMSIQVILPLLVVVQLVATILIITAVQYGTSVQGVVGVANHLQRKINEVVNATTQEILNRPTYGVSAMVSSYTTGGWNESDSESIRKMLWVQMQEMYKSDIVTALGVGTDDGTYIVYTNNNGVFGMSGSNLPELYGRPNMNPRGIWAMKVNQKTGTPDYATANVVVNATYALHTRPQYAGAVISSPDWFVTPIIPLVSGNPGLFIARSTINTNNHITGVVFVNMMLNLLNAKLGNLFVSPNGHVFITEPNGMIVASGLGNTSTWDVKRHLTNSSYMEPVREAAVAMQTKYGSFEGLHGELLALHTAKPEDQLIFTDYTDASGARKWVQISRLSFGQSVDWMVIVVIPEADYMQQIYISAGTTGGVTALVLVTSTAMAILLSLLITRPLRKLERQMESVSMMRLDSFSMYKKDKVTLHELGSIQESFVRMVYALRSFRKFVPDSVIRLAMEEQNVVNMSLEYKRDVTVFFLDIEDFTTLSEKLPLETLINVVSEALGACSDVVTEEGAIIDKYIGDAIMALFNVPTKIDNPHGAACRAALRCLKALEDLHENWKSRGLPQLKCRVGIHCGPCLVGIFGSSSRLNYTALGDTVNLAARLEPLNKVYKTRVLVSGDIYKYVKQDFCCTMVDNVTVKGKQNSTLLYELKCERSEATLIQQRVEKLMERWFTEFQDKNISGAMATIDEALQQPGYGDNPALLLQQERMRELHANPDLYTQVFEFKDKEF